MATVNKKNIQNCKALVYLCTNSTELDRNGSKVKPKPIDKINSMMELKCKIIVYQMQSILRGESGVNIPIYSCKSDNLHFRRF